MGKAGQSIDANLLRKKAEEFLNQNKSQIYTAFSEEEMLRTVHELEVYQIELEMQNNELIRAVENLEIETKKYYNLPIAYFTINSIGDIVDLNTCGAHILGKDRSKLINSRLSFFLSNDTKEIFNLFLDKIFRSGKKKNCEVTLLLEGKLPLYVFLSGMIFEDGAMCHISMVDITARIQSIENLRQSEERYKSLFHNNHSIMLLIDPENGAIKDANPAACKFYGWSHHAICNKNISEINTLSNEEISAEMQKASNEKRLQFYFNHRLANGEIRNVEVNSGPVQFGDTKLLYSLVHDVTDKKIIEEKLKKSEETYRNLVESISEAIYEIDVHGVIKYISPSIKTILGYSEQEIIGKNFIDFVGENAAHLSARLQLLNEKKELVNEYKINNKTGISKWIRFSSNAIIEDGNFKGASGTLTDITERKTAEEKLKKSEERYRMLVESINDVIYEISVEGIIKYVSPSVKRVLGYAADEVIGTNIIDFIYEEDKSMIYERISKLYEKDYSYLEYRYVNKKGNICWVRSSTNAIIENGKMIGASGLLTDITERKLAEIALKVSEEKYSKAFITSPYAILITQPEDGKIIEVNDAFENISGYSREEALADSSIGLNLWEDIEERKNVILQLSEGKEINRLECRFKIKSGDIITAVFSASVIYLDNKPFVLSSINDISHLKKTENALRESESLYRAILNASPEDITIADLNGNIQLVSPKGIIMFGFERMEQILNRNINDFLIPEDRERAQDVILKLYQGISIGNAEYHGIKADGSIIEIDVNAEFIRNSEGVPTNMIFIIRDITERVAAKKKLIEDQKIFRVLNELMSDYIFKLNIQSDGNYKMSVIAGNFTEATGRSIEDISTPSDWFKAVHPDDLPNLYSNLSQVVEQKQAVEIECRSYTEAGKFRWLNVIATPEIDAISQKVIGIFGSVRDITEKKVSIQNLLESEQKYFNLIDNLHAGIVVHSPDSGIMFSNSEASELLGLSQNQLKGGVAIDTDWYFMDEHGKKLAMDEYPVVKVISSLKPMLNQTYAINRPSLNDIVWVQVNAYPEFTDEGLLKQVVVTFYDISEIHEAEKSLKVNEEKYRNIFENILDVYYEATIDGTLLEISPSIEFISKGQYSRNELIGKSIISFYSDPEDRNRFFTDIQKQGKVTDYELSFYNKDGSIVPITITSGLLFDAEGNPVKIIGSMRDISERKLAEKVLQDNESKFKEIIQSQAEGIGFINQNEKFEFANYASATIFETEEDELIGASLFDFLYPDEVELINQQTENRKNRNTDSYELKIKTKKGNLKYIHVSASPKFDEKDNYLGSYGVFRDVTDRKLTEDALLASEENFRILSAQSPIAIEHYNKKGELITVNPACLSLFGVADIKEIENFNLFDDPNISDENKKKLKQNKTLHYQGIFDFEKVKEFKLCNTSKSGIIWIDTIISPLTDNQGNVNGYLVHISDISGRKQVENEIKNKSAVLSNLILNMQEGILLEDSERKILLCNQLFCDMYGIAAPPEALLGADCSESAEQNKVFFKNPEKFVTDIDLILKNKQAVFSEELELVDGRFFERDYIPTYIENEYSGHLWKYRDVTERKQNLLRIEKSEERFRQVVEQSEEVVWEVNADGLYTYVSPLAMKIYGYSQEQMVGKMYFYDLCPENEREHLRKTALELFQRKENFHDFVNSIHRLDGRIITVSTNGQPILDEKGILLGYRGIDVDITERLKAEIQLKESEEMFRLITEQTNDFIAIATENGIITYASSSSLQVFNLLPEEMQGRNFIEFVDEPEIPRAISLFNDSINKEQIIENTEFRMKRADGTLFFGEINGSKLLSDSHKGVLVAIRDITYRKNAEIALSKSEERYRFITERSNDLIFVFRLKPEMGFEYVSPSAERITGYTADEHYKDPMLGMKLVHPDDMHLLKSLQNGIVNEEAITLRWIKKDGSVIWTESHNIPIYNENGEITAIQGKATDITERIHSEQIIQTRLRLSEFAQTHSKNEIQQKFLDELEILTESTIGFFHSVNNDQKSLTLQTWSTNTLKNKCKAEAKGQLYSIEKAGVWTDCIKQRKAVIHNDYMSLAHKKGLPEGHAAVIRELVVPVFRNEKIVAIIGIGNKTNDYNENDIEMVALLADLAWDITERKGVEEDLQKLSLAVEQSPLIIYITNLEGIIDYANPKATEVSGYSSKELIGQNPRIFSSGEKPKEEYISLWKTISSGKEWKGEFHNKKKSGELYWVLASISPVINSNGIISHYIAIEEDITERKQTEEKIINQNEQLNAIISAMPDLIFAIDKNGNYTNFFSSNTENILMPVNQIIGSNIKTIFDKETADLHLQKIENCITQKGLITYEYEVTINNKITYFDARIAPLGSDKVLASVRDITDRKEKEAELKKLSQAIAQSPVTIVITDVKGNIEYTNPAFETTTGYSFEEAKRKNPKILKSGEMDESIYKELWESITRGKEWRGEWINKRKNGEFYWEDVSITPVLSEKGEIINYLAVKQDITQKKQSEKQILELNESLERKVSERTNELVQTNFILKKEIDNRKLADLSLVIEKQRLASIIEGTNVGTWEWNVITGENIVNERWAEIIGYTLDELFPVSLDTWINFIHPDDKDNVVELIRKHFKGEAYFTSEFRLKHKDGNWIWVLDRGKISKWDEKGKPLFMSGTLQDISERKLAEEELNWNKSLMELMSDSSPLGFLVVDNRTDEILYFNNRFCQIWGVEQIADQMQRGELKNNDIIPYCLPVLADIPAFAESCKPLQEESNRIVLEDEIAFTENRTVRRFTTQIRGINDEYYGRFYIFEEITQRKQSEEALKESREQLNLIIKGSNDAPWDWNLLTDNLFYSLRWWEQIGYLPEEIPSDSKLWKNLTHPDDVEYTNAILSNALNSNMDSYEAEFRLLHKKGHYVPVLSRGFISRDTSGNAIRVTGTNMDLTERKKVEKAILDSELKHSSMISNISDVIGIMGTDGVMIYKSPNIERYFGWKPEDLIGTDGWLTIYPDDLERIQTEFYDLLQTDNYSKTVEYRYKCKDGSYKPIELTATNLVNDPVIKGVLLNYHDITERNRAENALRESEKRFALFMDYLPAVVFFKDHEGKTLFVNKYMDEVFGASAWVGKTMLEIFPNEIGEKLNADDKNSIELGYQKIDESLIQLDGKLHNYETQKFVINREGQPPMLGGISLDITERKQAEEKILEAKDEAEKANLAKSEFLSRMSHELRTPMNSILGFAQLLEMGQLDVKQKKGVHHILQSGKHLLDMINEVLDISRIEAGYLSLQFESIQINNHLAECLDIIHPIAEKKHIKIQFLDSLNEHYYVYADSQRLKQVLLNLLNNAVKYNKNGGTVSIECNKLPVNDDGNTYLRVSIKDTGIGISADNINKLFIPFERIGAEKTEIEGTGLGLAVVKKLMDAMNGSIGVESKPGEGSCFWIELPINVSSFEAKKQQLENDKLTVALGIAKKETELQSQEIVEQTSALKLANNEIASQIIEKAKRAAELLIANEDLVLKNKEEVKLAAELLLAYKTIDIQNDEKVKLAAEQLITDLEMVLKSEEKEKLHTELLEKIRELSTQNESLLYAHSYKTGDKQCILYIEDNASNIELVNQILTSHRPEIRLIANKNGEKALELAIVNKPAFILLDLNLPDIHGKDVLILLQNDERTKNIPVVIISADAMPHQIGQLKKAGSKEYLCKPLDVNTFLEVVDKWTGLEK
ncbi:MAG: PAS domain S-box protein [Bacteroidales bacterium]